MRLKMRSKIVIKIVTPNETMHMNSSLVAKFGNGPARSHQNPKLWILTKLDPSKCIKAPQMAIFVFQLLN